MPASFEQGNNVLVNLPNNNINKGRWTPEEHKIFMQEYEKYGKKGRLLQISALKHLLKLKSMQNVFSNKI
jgi:hypothetical protein